MLFFERVLIKALQPIYKFFPNTNFPKVLHRKLNKVEAPESKVEQKRAKQVSL